MKFINTEPRKTRHIPEWSKNLEHEESRLWLMNTYEMAHVQELIEACEYQRLQWIEKGLRSPESELPTEDFNEVFNMIEKQHEIYMNIFMPSRKRIGRYRTSLEMIG
jgi:hypothetical protein